MPSELPVVNGAMISEPIMPVPIKRIKLSNEPNPNDIFKKLDIFLQNYDEIAKEVHFVKQQLENQRAEQINLTPEEANKMHVDIHSSNRVDATIIEQMMETVNELDGALEGSLKMNFHQLHSLVIKL